MILRYPKKDRASLFTPEGEQDAELDVVYYENKGTDEDPHWKLFLWTSYCQYFEATGTTMDKAVKTLQLEIENYLLTLEEEKYLGYY